MDVKNSTDERAGLACEDMQPHWVDGGPRAADGPTRGGLGREIGVGDSQWWAVRGGRGDVSGRDDKIRI